MKLRDKSSSSLGADILSIILIVAFCLMAFLVIVGKLIPRAFKLCVLLLLSGVGILA